MRFAIWLVVGAGCAGNSDDPTSKDQETTDVPAICVDAPVVTWDNFGSGFVTQFCDACHSSTTLDRHDAPADITFDSEEDVWSHSDRILARAAADPPTMPPMGGVSDEDRQLLAIWLTCGG